MLVFQRFLCDVMYSQSRSIDVCPWDWERTAVLRELFDIRFSYKHCNFSHFCLLVNMAVKTVTRSIQPCFRHGGSVRLACFEPTDAARFLKKPEVLSVLYGQGKFVFKREFLCLWKVHDQFLHLTSAWKNNQSTFEIDFFCLVFSRFNLRELIYDPVIVIREFLLRLTDGFLNKNFQEIIVIYLSLIIHNISSKHDRETTDRKIFRNTSQLRLKFCLYMFHWTAILFRIHHLPLKNFAVRCSFSITSALNTAETAYAWSLFSVVCSWPYILAEKVSSYKMWTSSPLF